MAGKKKALYACKAERGIMGKGTGDREKRCRRDRTYFWVLSLLRVNTAMAT